jgi:hypothetical protein
MPEIKPPVRSGKKAAAPIAAGSKGTDDRNVYTAAGVRPSGAPLLPVPSILTCARMRDAGFPKHTTQLAWVRVPKGARIVRGKIQAVPGAPFVRPIAWSESPVIGEETEQFALLVARPEDRGEHPAAGEPPCCYDAPQVHETMQYARRVLTLQNVRVRPATRIGFRGEAYESVEYRYGGFSSGRGWIGGGSDRSTLCTEETISADTPAEAVAFAWLSEREAEKIAQAEREAKRRAIIAADNCAYCPKPTRAQLEATDWKHHAFCDRCGGPCVPEIHKLRHCEHCGRTIRVLRAACTLKTFFRTTAHRSTYVGSFREDPKSENQAAAPQA